MARFQFVIICFIKYLMPLLLISACTTGGKPLVEVDEPALAAKTAQEKRPNVVEPADPSGTYNKKLLPLQQLSAELGQYRVVFVGERHDRYDHHLNQLAVIKNLYKDNSSLAIAMEFFQQPFQPFLDAYIAGEIDEQTMLEKTEYFSRWRYDYRFYAPILRFAKEHSIPLIALNLSSEITRQTSRAGIDSLTVEQQSLLPKDIDRDVAGYNDRIAEAFAMHGEIIDKGKLQNFIDAQLLWDEGMAERASLFLQEHPERQMIVLSGAGHIIYRTGIPTRLERRIHTPVITVLSAADTDEVEAEMADYFVLTKEKKLPEKGLMGILMGQNDNGINIQSFAENSAAKKAGLKLEDQLIRVEGREIKEIADVGLMLWQKKPGDNIKLEVLRGKDSPETLNFSFDLR